MGDANKKTLGFLPRAGFAAAASRGNVIVAVAEDGTLAAYCLYDLPREIIRLVHLCVASEHRGQGLARQLLTEVSRRHADRLGVRLKCRPDWPADGMWPGLGFEPRAQVPGRSQAGHLLTIWWKSHGHADLMSLLIDESEGQRVAVDTNVFCDLHSGQTRLGAKSSDALAPLVADDEIRIVVPPSVLTELYKTRNVADKQRYLTALTNYEILTVDDSVASAVQDQLLATVPATELKRDESLISDARLIAESIAGDVDVVVTRDENAVTQFAEPASELFETTLVAPAEINTVLDIADAAADYEPVSLQDTAFAVSRVQPADWTWPRFGPFLNKGDGETRASLRDRMHDFALRSTVDCRRELLTDPNGQAQAAWVTSLHGTDVIVRLLRVAPGRSWATVARQLAFHLRAEAARAGRSRVVIDDPMLPSGLRDLFRTEGFTWNEEDRRLVGFVISECGSWEKVRRAAESVGWRLASEPIDDAALSPVAIAELERTLWPAKILGKGLRNYFVPIRGVFSSQLLGYPLSLMGRDDVLGMSREQVYYRAPSRQPEAPARLLWYSSVYPQEVIATSRLVEAATGRPVPLYRRFARLGVYTLADVRDASKRGQVGALRFADTELFSRPVPLGRYMTLATPADRRKVSVGSIQAISDETFERTYCDGMQR